MTINFLQAGGYFLFSGVGNIGDWAVVMQGFQPAWFWRVGLTTLGVGSYLMLIGVSSQFLAAEDSEITNARVIEMTKIGLGEDIIIARIKTGSCQFALSDNDLAQLKRANVSDKVVAAMLESSVLTRPRVTIDGNPLELHTIGQEKSAADSDTRSAFT